MKTLKYKTHYMNEYLKNILRHLFHCFIFGNILFNKNNLDLSTCNFDEAFTSNSFLNVYISIFYVHIIYSFLKTYKN